MDADKLNGNISFAEKTTSLEDLSEYTDADESISTPTEILSEFLSSIMAKDYSSAFKFCKDRIPLRIGGKTSYLYNPRSVLSSENSKFDEILISPADLKLNHVMIKIILQYEPNHQTAKEFFPLLLEKCKFQNTSNKNSYKNLSDDDEDEEVSCSSSSENSDVECSSDGFSDERSTNSGDADQENESSESHSSEVEIEATTTSYSSLEDDGEIQNQAYKQLTSFINGNRTNTDTQFNS